jgi:hypothetical protein
VPLLPFQEKLLLTAIIIFDVINTLIAFFTLARTGRIITEQNELVELFIFSHNQQIEKFKALNEKIDSALDSLLTADASTASSDTAD